MTLYRVPFFGALLVAAACGDASATLEAPLPTTPGAEAAGCVMDAESDEDLEVCSGEEIASAASSLLGNCPSNLEGVTSDGSCYCAPSSSVGGLWGTGVYTSDSHLCTAAVHSGVITQSAGGDVSYSILPGRSAYCGSSQHGVTSSGYGAWVASYSVGGAELQLIQRESLTHTYTARHTGANTYTLFTASSGCMIAPVSISYSDANDGELRAIDGDGAQVVLDAAWAPFWDSYTPVSDTWSACSSLCPSN